LDSPVAPRQVDLEQRLETDHATLSRRLRRATVCGFVRRAPCPRDRRCRIVTLTPEGLRRLRGALRELLHPA
jgi:DNA-binding MarR family transcriptional regulator